MNTKILKHLFFACIIGLAPMMHAENVSQKEAKNVAERFFAKAFGDEDVELRMVWNGRQLTTDRLFSPFYVFNLKNKGYVIVSGENKAYPILAYSLKREFDRSGLTEDENKLLKKYAHEIEIIRYDPRMPVNAIYQWQNLSKFFDTIINEPYSIFSEFNGSEVEKSVLREKIELIDRLGNQIMMPSAVEFKLYDPMEYRDLTLEDLISEESPDEYIPFSFYDEFIKEIKREDDEMLSRLSLSIVPDKPEVQWVSSGNYLITCPENIKMLRVYSLNGLQVSERYFKNSNNGFINIEGEAPGYYIALILTEVGKIYGLKLSR